MHSYVVKIHREIEWSLFLLAERESDAIDAALRETQNYSDGTVLRQSVKVEEQPE